MDGATGEQEKEVDLCVPSLEDSAACSTVAASERNFAADSIWVKAVSMSSFSPDVFSNTSEGISQK